MASRMQNWIDHQRRHLSPDDFAAWVAGTPKVQAFIARQSKIPAAVRSLEDLQRDILKKVMAPGVEKGAAFLATQEKAGVRGNRTGTLRQAIGSAKAKLYLSSLTAWAAAGPRRGYGRIIVAQSTTRGIRLKRTSKKFTTAHHGQVSTFANPVQYAHFLITGRKASIAGAGKQKAKSLHDPFTGRFFGHSVRAAAPRDFMAPAEASVGQAVTIANDEMNARLPTVVHP